MEPELLDDEPTGLELLQQMRHQIEELESSSLAAAEPTLMAAVRRLLEQERTGEVDDENELFFDDLRQVTLGLMRLDFDDLKGNGRGGRKP